MSDQNAIDIPFSLCHDRQALKLIELPADLLALLESDDPPRMHLKSDTCGNAQLVTSTKAYRIQQKNTSNPIMVLAPSTTASIHQASDASRGIDAVDETPQSSVTVISTVQDTLELLAVEESTDKPMKKVNKWHEKFGKGRASGAPDR